jgi:hypothetical protein
MPSRLAALLNRLNSPPRRTKITIKANKCQSAPTEFRF